MKHAFVLLADGFETIEALTPVDILRRCGVATETVSISDSYRVNSSHGINVEADRVLGNGSLERGDIIIIPGGYPGYVNIGNSEAAGVVIKEYWRTGKYVAAICGSPTVLALNGIAKGSRITCHSSVRDKMSGYIIENKGIVIDGKLITGSGAGHSLDFSLTIAQILTDKETVALLNSKLELV